MADEPGTTELNTPPPADPPPADGTPPPGDGERPLGENGESALRKERDRAKQLDRDLKSALAELQSFRDKDKTDADKLRDAATAAEDRANKAESTLLRLQIAADKGLTAAQASRLVGTNREELEADADQLLADFKAPPARPAGAVDQGHQGSTGGPSQVTEAELKSMTPEAIVKAQQEGRLKDLLG